MKRVAVYALTIAIGLYVSAKYAEWPVNIWCIGLFVWLFNNAEKRKNRDDYSSRLCNSNGIILL